MAPSVGTESERWCIVLVVELDGSPVLHVRADAHGCAMRSLRDPESSAAQLVSASSARPALAWRRRSDERTYAPVVLR
jgi:hypothetical protein